MIVRARDNPFRSERVLEFRYRPQGWTWQALLDRLMVLHYRGAIVGPQGAGKTTLLEDLIPRLENLGFATRFARLDCDAPRLSQDAMNALVAESGPRDIILLDGCEQLPPRDWRKFARLTQAAGGLIITTHLPSRLPTLVECRTSPQLLEQIVHDLAGGEYAGEINFVQLMQHHGGNIRDAIRELYDTYAVRESGDW